MHTSIRSLLPYLLLPLLLAWYVMLWRRFRKSDKLPPIGAVNAFLVMLSLLLVLFPVFVVLDLRDPLRTLLRYSFTSLSILAWVALIVRSPWSRVPVALFAAPTPIIITLLVGIQFLIEPNRMGFLGSPPDPVGDIIAGITLSNTFLLLPAIILTAVGNVLRSESRRWTLPAGLVLIFVALIIAYTWGLPWYGRNVDAAPQISAAVMSSIAEAPLDPATASRFVQERLGRPLTPQEESELALWVMRVGLTGTHANAEFPGKRTGGKTPFTVLVILAESNWAAASEVLESIAEDGSWIRSEDQGPKFAQWYNTPAVIESLAAGARRGATRVLSKWGRLRSALVRGADGERSMLVRHLLRSANPSDHKIASEIARQLDISEPTHSLVRLATREPIERLSLADSAYWCGRGREMILSSEWSVPEVGATLLVGCGTEQPAQLLVEYFQGDRITEGLAVKAVQRLRAVWRIDFLRMVLQGMILQNQKYRYPATVPSGRAYPLALAYLAEEFPSEFCPKVLEANAFYQKEGKRLAMPDEIAVLSAVRCEQAYQNSTETPS